MSQETDNLRTALESITVLYAQDGLPSILALIKIVLQKALSKIPKDDWDNVIDTIVINAKLKNLEVSDE
jgi:hypothetical protein